METRPATVISIMSCFVVAVVDVGVFSYFANKY